MTELAPWIAASDRSVFVATGPMLCSAEGSDGWAARTFRLRFSQLAGALLILKRLEHVSCC